MAERLELSRVACAVSRGEKAGNARRQLPLVLAAFGVLAAAVAISPIVPAITANAQTGTVPAILAGTYRYSRDAAHGNHIVEATVEPRIVDLPWFMQRIARDRMREMLRVALRITIAVSGTRTSVTYEGERTTVVASSVPGSTTVTDSARATMPVTQRLSEGWLEQSFALDNGTIDRLLSCEPDGRILHLDTTLTSERLGAPIRFRLDYIRATP